MDNPLIGVVFISQAKLQAAGTLVACVCVHSTSTERQLKADREGSEESDACTHAPGTALLERTGTGINIGQGPDTSLSSSVAPG